MKYLAKRELNPEKEYVSLKIETTLQTLMMQDVPMDITMEKMMDILRRGIVTHNLVVSNSLKLSR